MRVHRLLVPLVLLTACSPAPAAPPASSAPAEVTIHVVLAGGRVTPNGERRDVKLGTPITFEVTSDHDDTLHVHGYDTELAVHAGRPARTRIVANRPGRYEVESHSPAMTLLFLNVRS